MVRYFSKESVETKLKLMRQNKKGLVAWKKYLSEY